MLKVEVSGNVVQTIVCKSCVLKVKWKDKPFVTFLNILQNPKLCSNGTWPKCFPLLVWIKGLSINSSFNIVLFLSSSLILSRSDEKSLSFLAKCRIVAQTGPT